ncbi:signal recognition particle-docking protein FtsY [Buchnera aphidicola]|uniref:Signal recognition particle receptor n=1 Tax=Buchnera aphidicola subsp. Cinara cedri (strain Cc) TaxID=372461 RepID=Q058E9_BUCCC|nr:signal recognition particle-docking protein FtsY [Buchnera aphidicola]ABJ90500.1 signal recognition particle receptor [Buchnera aphidicola BCc]
MCGKKNFFSHLNIFSKKKNVLNKDLKSKDKIDNISDNKKSKIGIFSFLKNYWNSTKDIFTKKLKNIFLNKNLDKKFFKKLEDILLSSDFGVQSTKKILNLFKEKIKKNNITDTKIAKVYFKEILLKILKKSSKFSDKNNYSNLLIILVVGINGVGKTTAVVKLANYYKNLGKSVILSACDTFRSAAIDQLIDLGNLYNIEIFYKSIGSDPSSVAFDSIIYAKKKKIDIVIIDTAGRMHNKMHLIQELKKMNRVIKKCCSTAFYKTYLVIDAGIGQNSIQQAKIFSSEINISGSIITKLDSTAKGGIIFSIINDLKIPICYISAGEKITDFNIFDYKYFIENFYNIF